MNSTLEDLLTKALASRSHLFDPRHETALRLFNGFSEGHADLSLDLYGTTVVFYNYAEDANEGRKNVLVVSDFLRRNLNWLRAGIVKSRNSLSAEERRGTLLFGDSTDRKVIEHKSIYALNLTMNRDASLYLDTRNLRKWLNEAMHGKSVLNMFAYTGSFGVAALTGKASRVVQVDRNQRFLNLGKESYKLNGYPVNNRDFLAFDFFPAVSRFKQSKELFDCVILDPPFYSSTTKGKVDQVNESARLINKVRPLVQQDGWLVAINNAVYVSGQDYMQTLDHLGRDGYVRVEEIIPVPEDFIGYHPIHPPITDPAPFNHSTKIAILKIKRKSSQTGA